VIVLPLEVIAEDVDKKPEDLSHEVSDDDCNSDEDEDHVDALNWIFRSDVSISYCCEDTDAEVHGVDIHLPPVQNDCHVVESPSVIDPANIGGVRAVVIVGIYPKTDQIKEDSHIMSIYDPNYC
jgi:hypothetical protein